MKKNINNIIAGAILTILNTGFAFADGYPYGGHKPIDTGMESGIFYLGAIILFSLGLLILFIVKALKEKISAE